MHGKKSNFTPEEYRNLCMMMLGADTCEAWLDNPPAVYPDNPGLLHNHIVLWRG